MAYTGLTVNYYVAKAGNPPLIPGNCQTPVNSHDNPDNGTNAQRTAACLKTSPDAVVVVAP